MQYTVIPQIIIYREGEALDGVVAHFALEYDIDSTHRIVVSPEKNELTVDQIHLLQKDIQVSFSKKVLVVLIGVDDSSNEVQNSLLKCIEEMSERIQFLFLVKNVHRMLPTILSRCARVEEKNRAESEKGAPDQNMFTFQNNSDVTKEEAVKRIDMFIQSPSLKNHHILSHMLQIRKLIVDNNMNPVLALDNILLFLSKTGTMNVSHEKI